MKPFIKTLLFFFIAIQHGIAQDSVATLSTKMFDKNNWVILLSPMKGWLFKEGNNQSWANKDITLDGWKKMSPTELSAKYADKSGKAEGWFRFKFELDSSFHNFLVGFRRGCWAATDLYLDGNFLASFGNTGFDGKSYKEYNPIDKLSVSTDIRPGTEHLLAIHFVDYLSPLPPRQLKSETNGGTRPESSGLRYFIMLASSDYNSNTLEFSRRTLLYRSIWLSATTLLAILFWLLVFQNPTEKKTLVLIAMYSSFSALSNLTRFPLTNPGTSFTMFEMNDLLLKFSSWMMLPIIPMIITEVLNFRASRNFRRFLIIYPILGVPAILFNFSGQFVLVNTVVVFLIIMYILAFSWKKLKAVQWAIVGGSVLSIVFISQLIILLDISYKARLLLLTCVYFSFPLSLIVYVSLRFREIIREVEANARQVVKMTKEREEQAIQQQKILEQEVERQTAELRITLNNLRSTQSQLIQSEKMASLGELTAGIAHEIQNPLNFVNNFSEVNNELIEELRIKNEKLKIEDNDINDLLNDIYQNNDKISMHGKRADAIVKGMLQHSRTSSGQKELTDINALAEEYLRLAYHGLRAKDKSFNAKFETGFDASIGKINIVPQDIGRVLLNLINNAFYAVNEKLKRNISGYEPIVIVSTRAVKPPSGGRSAQIKVIDNGGGIPQNVVDKIFQPFFTTKPTGQGTGLGLSMSYDIIKAHAGEIKVETKEGEGSKFTIILPGGQS
jgi:signal transduction histidine kinase